VEVDDEKAAALRAPHAFDVILSRSRMTDKHLIPQSSGA
jgi:hypothetical protein